MGKNVILEVQNLSKAFDKTQVLKSLSLGVVEGEFFSIIGPSGSGKSTLLKIIAGAEDASGGHVLFNGKKIDLSGANAHDIVMVWQSLALFPHMNIEENVGFGLKMRGENRETIKQKVSEVLAVVGLQRKEKKRVHELSGGEQQRVALARSLVVKPKVLLLDEPLGSLDEYIREELQAELKRIHKNTGITFVMVTHDQSEAMSLSDRIAVLNDGVLEQIGTPEELMRSPRTAFVARFVGDKNVLDGTIESVTGKNCVVRTSLGKLTARISNSNGATLGPGTRVAYVVEASDIEEGGEHDNRFRGTIWGILVRGSSQLVRVELTDGEFMVYERFENERVPIRLQMGQPVTVSWGCEKAYLIKK